MSENVNNYFKNLFEEAHRLSLMSKFVQADEICHRLLREPTLPFLYRAGCNFLLAFGDDNPVGFAKEAVHWYQEMYNEVQDHPVNGPHHKLLLEQAQDALANAEREAAEQADEDDEDGEAGEPEEGVEVSEQGEAGEDVGEIQESEIEAAPTSSQATDASETPSSSIGGATVIPSSSPVATQVENPTAATTGDKKEGSDEDEAGSDEDK